MASYPVSSSISDLPSRNESLPTPEVLANLLFKPVKQQTDVRNDMVAVNPARLVRQRKIESLKRPLQKASDPVFPHEGSNGRFDTRSWFQPCLEEAKIADYVWHANRHTFYSWLAMTRASIKEIQKLPGHKTITMSARYSHLSPEHRLSVIDRIWNEMGFGGRACSVLITIFQVLSEVFKSSMVPRAHAHRFRHTLRRNCSATVRASKRSPIFSVTHRRLFGSIMQSGRLPASRVSTS